MTATTASGPRPGEHTLVACWRALARTSSDATVLRTSGAIVATFPSFAPMNNAIMSSPHDADLWAESDRLKGAYRRAGVSSWAAWIRSRATSFEAADAIPELRGFKRDATTLVMEAKRLPSFRTSSAVRLASIDAASRAGDEPVPTSELGETNADGKLAGWVMTDGDVAVAGAYRFLHGSDCGVYAVGTAPAWRRRGLARRLVEHLLADASRRGARSATLQSTSMAQNVYASLGFAAVGRYEEWVPE